MENVDHRHYFKPDEIYFLLQEENNKIIFGLIRVMKIFKVHPWAQMTELQQQLKIDSFETLRMDDPFDKIIKELQDPANLETKEFNKYKIKKKDLINDAITRIGGIFHQG